ncbi:Pectate lyase superfamily protein [uncultured Caudovirales phage]|uniref:Pectate lyase superfamily protein n=1 Tax=uncultured Caudovirales phage TaxID=2100421 RepID=A0A6J5NXB2_9CAUD|nr:Pectate lyase superfamily protein [uncultured Caudovirales phage]
MQQYQNVLQDKFGNVIVGASVAVYVYGTTTPATIYSGNGIGLLPSNTVTTNSLGEFAFYAANGRYSLSITATNFVAESYTDFILYDPADIGAVAASGVAFTPFSTIAATNVQNAIQEVVTDLSASSGSSLVGFLQSGTSAQATTVQAKLRKTVSVKDFGAVGNGIADDTAAIQAAADYAASINGTLYADSGTYKITSTVTISCNCEMSAALFNVNAALVAVGIIVGSTTAEIRARVMSLPRINNTAKTTTGWAAFSTSVGIDVANLFMSHVIVPSIKNFAIGLDVGGYTHGNAYNNYFIGELFDNKISIRCRKKGGSGYSNQNTFYGGQYGISGAEGTSISGSYGISLEATTNNNTFVNPSLEANGNQFQVSISDSGFNTFVNPRFEITGGGRVNFYSSTIGYSQQNTFVGGYNYAGPIFTYTGVASTLNRLIGDKLGDYNAWSPRGMVVLNENGDGATSPHFTGMQATATGMPNLLTIDPTTTTLYGYKLYSQGLIGKRYTDTYDRIKLDWGAGKLYVGDGSAALSQYIGYYAPGVLQVGGFTNFIAGSDNSTTNGTASFRWSNTYSTNFRPGAGTATWTSGAGTPEASVTATVGSMYTRTDGGAGTTLYVKESGTGNTGWVAK